MYGGLEVGLNMPDAERAAVDDSQLLIQPCLINPGQ